MTRAACITLSWDDGHPLDMRIAELMAKHGLRGTFYVPRSTERQTIGTSEIRQLGSAFEVGAHTLRHIALTGLSDRDARLEIAGAKRWLEDITGTVCPMFCPPAGRYERRHLEMIDRAGYEAVRTTELLSLDWPRTRGKLALMPTAVQAWPHGARAYLQNVAKRFALRNFWRYASCGHIRDWPAISRTLLLETLRRGGVFHLWAHSWEIDASGDWRRLDDVMRLLAEHASAAPALTNGEVCRYRHGSVPCRAALQRRA